MKRRATEVGGGGFDGVGGQLLGVEARMGGAGMGASRRDRL